MAKGTIITLFLLSLLATLLFGINIGKKLNFNQSINLLPTAIPITPTPSPFPTIYLPSPSPSSISASIISTKTKVMGTSSFANNTCGYSFFYSVSFLQEKTVNQKSVFTDPDDPNGQIVIVCDTEIPRPPVSSDKIESKILGGAAATLYHDQKPDGTPRDEIIVKHPENGMEIIIVGYGPSFKQILSSFRFL